MCKKIIAIKSKIKLKNQKSKLKIENLKEIYFE